MKNVQSLEKVFQAYFLCHTTHGVLNLFNICDLSTRLSACQASGRALSYIALPTLTTLIVAFIMHVT